MLPLSPIPLGSSEKLDALRRIDSFRPWHSLADKRLCLQCGDTVTGWEVEIVGGTRGLGPLRIQCPTRGCPATAMDLALPQPGVQPQGDRSRQGTIAPDSAPSPTGGSVVARRRAFEKLLRVLKFGRTTNRAN